VFGLARRVDLDAVTPIAVDWADVGAVRAALAPFTFDQALLYCPTAPVRAVAAMRAAVTGRVVHLLTSAAVTPPSTIEDLPDDGSVHVVLGWTADRRWHTPDELSAAALDALRTGADAVLGKVRPWSDRPA
jgi:hypothetical protein